MAEPSIGIQDERASAWVDRVLEGEERERFEAALADDPALSRELEDLEDVVTALRGLPVEEAPPDFLAAVQSRIRRRSRGRYFGTKYRYRFPYEAVVNGILLGLLMAVYIIAMPTPDDIPMPLSPEMVRQGSAMPSVGAAILTQYGRVEVESARPDGREVTYIVLLAADRVDDLRHELGLYPDLVLLDVEDTSSAMGTKAVRVKARAAPY